MTQPQTNKPGSIDLLLDRIEPLATSDVQTSAPSADLVTLESESNGLEIFADKGALKPHVPIAHEVYPLALREHAPAVVQEIAPEPMPLAIPERLDLDTFVDANDDSDLQNIHSFFGAHAAYQVALDDLRAGRNEEAKRILEQLHQDHPGISEYLATLMLARFRSLRDPADKITEAGKLAEQAQAYRFCVTTRAVLGRMYIELERPHAATRFLREAVELEPERSDLLADLRTANAMLLAHKEDASTELLDPLARERFPGKRRAAKSEHEERSEDARGLVIALGVFVAVAFGLFFASNELRLGENEAWIKPFDPFFWARNAALLIAGLAGVYFVQRHRPIAIDEIMIAPTPMFAALSLGMLIGINAPLGVTKSALGSVAAMVFAQVVAEEVFFRAYLGRVLMRGLVGSMTPILLSATLYAVYQLTFFVVWHGGAPGATAFYRIAIATAAGATYATLHQKSESMSAPLIAHVAAATAMIVGSMY